jgi:hypothetical protein
MTPNIAIDANENVMALVIMASIEQTFRFDIFRQNALTRCS